MCRSRGRAARRCWIEANSFVFPTEVTRRTMSETIKSYTALSAIVLLSVVLLGSFTAAVSFAGLASVYLPSVLWVISWYSIFFFSAWWVLYYHFSEKCPHESREMCNDLWNGTVSNKSIITLRTFLEFNTARGLSGEEEEDELTWKASNTIGTVGTIVGISLLILSFTISTLIEQDPLGGSVEAVGVLTAFADRFFVLTSIVLTLQIAAVVQFLISVDSLDTSMNEFSRVSGSVSETYQLTQGFYVRGIKRYYNGLILFVLSLFLLTMVVSPVVTIIGVAAFAYLGYDYWFGYVDNDA